ncbi:MAG: CPBP family intramembrane metalloprotease [Saccharofermentans sp.]|nr:CPBP family intramembrane metalloprotease [Saccharofermentans sp.]
MDKKISWIKCIAAIICAGVISTASNFLSWLVPQGGMDDNMYGFLTYLVTGSVQAIGLILLLCLFKRKDVFANKPTGSFSKGIVLGIVLIVYAAYMLVSNLISCIRENGTPGMSPVFMTIYIVGIFMGAGIGEEFIFRGIFMNFIRSAAGNRTRKGLLIGMTVSSVCFGLVHLANLQDSADVVGTIGQVIYAVGIGFYLAAIYARTKNIWFNVVLHFFVDISALFNTLFTSSEVSVSEVIGGDPSQVIIRSILLGAVFWAMGLFMVRKRKMPELA